MSEQRDFYSREAANYEKKRYGSRYGRLFRALQRVAVERGIYHAEKPVKILDVATGTGQMLPVLAKSGTTVVASDLTPAMLLEARSAFSPDSGIDYCIADATQLPYGGADFDIVASSRFLHLFEPSKQQLLLCEMARVLKPGGILIVDFYSADVRKFFALPIWLYRTIFRKRPEKDYRTNMLIANEMLERAGLQIICIEGIGNFFLLPLLWLPLKWLIRLGAWLGRRWPGLSEQYLVVARKA